MVAWLERTVDALGYPGIALLTFLENVFPPIPSEVVMPLAGFAASRGELSFVGVVIAGVVGAVSGAVVLYYVGQRIGEDRVKGWADQYGDRLVVSSKDIEKATRWFNRYGDAAVFISRVVPGVRSLISIPAGVARMGLAAFLFYSSLGMAVWATFLASLGYLLGESYILVERYLGPAGYVVFALIVLAFVVWLVRRKREAAAERDRKEEPELQ